MPKYTVLFFEKENGEVPVETFLNSLDKKMLAKMTRTISALQESGSDLREPYSKHLDDEIFELRAQVASNTTRVLYFFVLGHRVILTNGFIKKTLKTPISEINKAKAYRKEYLNREEIKNEGI